MRIHALNVCSSILHALSPGKDSARIRFARGSFWLLAGTFLAQSLSMAAAMVTARMLGKNGFGELGMITSTVGTLGLLAGLGFGITATKFIAAWKHTDKTRAGRFIRTATVIAVVSGAAMALLTFWHAPWIAAHMLNAPAMAPLLRLASTAVLFQTLTATLTGMLAGFEMFKEITRVNTFQGLLNFPVMIAGAWYFGITGAVAGTVLTAVVGTVLAHRAVRGACARHGILPHFGCDRTELAGMFNFSLPAFLSSLLVGPALWLANTIIAHQPDGYGELGIINAASQWRIVLMTLPGIFAGATLPILTEQHAEQGRNGKFAATLDFSQKAAGMVVIPLYAAIIFLGDIIMRLYGKEFPAGYPVLAGLVFGMSLAALLNVAGSAFAALGKMWLGLSLNLVWAAAFVGGVIVLAPRLGAEGYALAFGISYVILFSATCLALKDVLLPATLRRIGLSMLAVLLITACGLMLTPAGRLYTSLPVICLSALLTIHISGKETFMHAYAKLRALIEQSATKEIRA